MGLDDEEVRYGSVNRKVGYVFHRDTVFPAHSRGQHRLRAEIAGRAEGRSGRTRWAPPIEAAGLAGFDKSFPRTLSGGCVSAWR